MLNKKEVKIYLPNELKNNDYLQKIGLIDVLSNTKLIRFTNDLKLNIKDEIERGSYENQRELTIEHKYAWFNMESNSSNETKLWVTDIDHKGYNSNHKQNNLITKLESHRILISKTNYIDLILAFNDLLTFFSTTTDRELILMENSWTFSQKEKGWTDLRSIQKNVNTNYAYNEEKQKAIKKFKEFIE